MIDADQIDSVKLISDKKVCISSRDGRVHQRRYKDGRFTFNGHVYEMQYGDFVKIKPAS